MARPLIWGSHARERNGQSAQQAVEDLEEKLGQRLRAIRVYSRWGDRVPDRFESWLGQTNRLMLFSVKPQRRDGTKLSWASIADAAPGGQLYGEMEQLGADLAAFGKPIYLILHHEPEAAANTEFGSPADFVRAWRSFATVIRSKGATNVKFLWTMIDYSFSVPADDRRFAGSWYPGDDVVDAIGGDAYNWYRCRGRDEGWRSLAEIIEPMRRFGQLHPGKELWLPEFGTVEDPASPGRKAAWLDEARNLFATPGYEQFHGVTYFHDEDATYAACDWWIDTSPSSIAGFGRMGAAGTFGGPVNPDGSIPVGNVSQLLNSARASIPGQRLRPAP